MPPRKRAAAKTPAPRPTRAKRPRPSGPPEVEVNTPADPPAREPQHNQGLVSIDVNAISSTISTVVAQALQSALSQDNIAALLTPRSAGNQDDVEQVVANVADEIVADGSPPSGTGGVPSRAGGSDPRPPQVFTSISVGLTSRVSAKLKGKIWANDYVDFGSLLFSSPQSEGKYSLSMTPSTGSSNRPQLTIEPCHNTKRIQTIHQWVSAFNIFVSVYTERFRDVTPQLMKYCEVVRDLAVKAGDWLWYDEQYRYIRQSDPEKFPWDQIHWELWLRASSTFRRQQPSTNKPQTQSRPRFRQPFFPKGTCWAFQAGKHCSGCQFEHVCYKCSAKHPGSQCSVQANQTRFGGVGSKGKGGSTQISGASQPTGHTNKGGSA